MVHSLFQLTQKFFQTFILWISNSKLYLRQLFLSFLSGMKWKIPIYYIEFESFFYRIKNIAFLNHQSFSLEFLQINLILIRFYADQSILNSLLINISTKNHAKFIAFIQQNLNYSATTSCTNLEIFFIFKIFNLQLINIFNELINKPFCSQENRRRKYISHNLIDSFVDNSLMFSQFLVLFQFVICSLLNLIIHVILIQQKHFNSSIIKLIFTLINHQTHTSSQMSTAQKIAQIQAEMERTQKNKATSYHVGLLKAKLAKLKRQLIEPPGGKKGTAGQGFQVSKSGDARVGMIGFPSVGKSTLLTKLTGTFSKIAAYQFTTLTCVPGVLMHKGAKIQLLDLPGIIEGAKDGKGRGRQVIAVARTCNLIVIVLDATRPMGHKKIIEHQLQGFGIRLNKSPPQIDFKKKDKGGIIISRMVDTDKVSDQTIKAILKQYKINNADICLKCDATEDDIIDIIEGNRKYIPCLYALNKIDAITLDQLNILDQIQHYVPIAGDLGWNLDQLVQRMWEYLDLIRVYTKPKGKDPDYSMPVILPRTHSLIEDFCLRIHRNMIKDFRYAMVWGTSVKFNPQKVGKDHNLLDQDVVQIIKKI